MIARAKRENQNVAGFPRREKNWLVSPLKSSIAKMPRNGTKTPVSKMPKEERIVWPSLSCPTRRGNTRLPDPKNIENMANPADRTLVLAFMTYSLIWNNKEYYVCSS